MYTKSRRHFFCTGKKPVWESYVSLKEFIKFVTKICKTPSRVFFLADRLEHVPPKFFVLIKCSIVSEADLMSEKSFQGMTFFPQPQKRDGSGYPRFSYALGLYNET